MVPLSTRTTRAEILDAGSALQIVRPRPYKNVEPHLRLVRRKAVYILVNPSHTWGLAMTAAILARNQLFGTLASTLEHVAPFLAFGTSANTLIDPCPSRAAA